MSKPLTEAERRRQFDLTAKLRREGVDWAAIAQRFGRSRDSMRVLYCKWQKLYAAEGGERSIEGK